MMWMPLLVSRMGWTGNASFGSSFGSTSTPHVSAPTATTFWSASHRAASLPGPGSPELNTAFCLGNCSNRLPQPVWMITMSPSRSVVFVILSAPWTSAALMTVPLSRHGLVHAGFDRSLFCDW